MASIEVRNVTRHLRNRGEAAAGLWRDCGGERFAAMAAIIGA
jgi:hypothetical protein